MIPKPFSNSNRPPQAATGRHRRFYPAFTLKRALVVTFNYEAVRSRAAKAGNWRSALCLLSWSLMIMASIKPEKLTHTVGFGSLG